MKRIREYMDNLGYKCIDDYASPQYIMVYEKDADTSITVTKWRHSDGYKLEIAQFYGKNAMRRTQYCTKYYQEVIKLISRI